MARYKNSYNRFRGGFRRRYSSFRRSFSSFRPKKNKWVSILTALLLVVGLLALIKPTWLKDVMSKFGLKTA